MSWSDGEISALVEPDRVHRKAYTDPDIFELEMERIFEKLWIYIGHESQVKKPGDYYLARVGRQPMVMTRDQDGQIHVLYNRCPHRGAQLCTARKGNAGRSDPLLLPRLAVPAGRAHREHPGQPRAMTVTGFRQGRPGCSR